jgi:hypothetical protein
MSLFHRVFYAVLLALTGCVSVSTIVGPDGRKNELISCPDISLCYEKATAVCSGKYMIVNSSTSVANGQSMNQLLVECSNGGPIERRAESVDP